MDEMGKHLNGMRPHMDRTVQTTRKMTGYKTPAEKKYMRRPAMKFAAPALPAVISFI